MLGVSVGDELNIPGVVGEGQRGNDLDEHSEALSGCNVVTV